MITVAHTEPLVRRAPDDHDAPWLTGNGPRWFLIEDVLYTVEDELIVVPAGYIFDGSSVPQFLWWLYPPSFAVAWRASCLHDFGYSHLHHYYSKDFFDRALRELMLQDGAKPKDTRRFYWATSKFGRGGWKNR